ncbi:hypothetical protein [Catenuloplanes indicus]|uniref:Uncharacterized protein n=1 Tax=Catenuloplanes indicus TaxID=137267 RepID=A0AAE3W601_9ACTN|nr:hypothetical protein [Catenuloplanes indicus]MDQ0370543.1 hypothetical protein [Catenuloplanes indicus]
MRRPLLASGHTVCGYDAAQRPHVRRPANPRRFARPDPAGSSGE